MKHIDWLDPDNIIVNNSDNNKEFLSDIINSKELKIRLVMFNSDHYIRYKIDNLIKIYNIRILDKRGNDYYINMLRPLTKYYDPFEIEYIKLNRDELLAEILK